MSGTEGTQNRVIRKLESGDPVLAGAFVNDPGVTAAGFLGLGYDAVFIDMEHAGYDTARLRTNLRELRAVDPVNSPVPLVRVPGYGPERNAWTLKQVLDQGAYGLALPHCESAADAAALVEYSRYPEQGHGAGHDSAGRSRGWSPAIAAEHWGVSADEYFRRSGVWGLDDGGELLLMPIIENVRGVRNIEEIVATPGINTVWAATGDLAISLGVGPNFLHEDVLAAQEHIRSVAHAAGVAVAVVALNDDDLDARLEAGYEIIVTVPSPHDAMLDMARSRLAQV